MGAAGGLTYVVWPQPAREVHDVAEAPAAAIGRWARLKKRRDKGDMAGAPVAQALF